MSCENTLIPEPVTRAGIWWSAFPARLAQGALQLQGVDTSLIVLLHLRAWSLCGCWGSEVYFRGACLPTTKKRRKQMPKGDCHCLGRVVSTSAGRHCGLQMHPQLCRTPRNFLNKLINPEKSHNLINAFGFAGPLQRALKYYTSGRGVPPSWVWTQCLFIQRGHLVHNYSIAAELSPATVSLCGFLSACVPPCCCWDKISLWRVKMKVEQLQNSSQEYEVQYLECLGCGVIARHWIRYFVACESTVLSLGSLLP